MRSRFAFNVIRRRVHATSRRVHVISERIAGMSSRAVMIARRIEDGHGSQHRGHAPRSRHQRAYGGRSYTGRLLQESNDVARRSAVEDELHVMIKGVAATNP